MPSAITDSARIDFRLDGLLGAALPDTLGWDATTYILTGTGRRDLTADERAALKDLAAKFPLLR